VLRAKISAHAWEGQGWNADMHICFTQGFGQGATAFACEGNDGHIAFMGSMQGTHQTFFFTSGREQQQDITRLA
jgi:hypothetical protein